MKVKKYKLLRIIYPKKYNNMNLIQTYSSFSIHL